MAEVGSARVSESQQKSNYRRSESGLGLVLGPGERVGGTGREKPGHEVGAVKLMYVYTHTYIYRKARSKCKIESRACLFYSHVCH